MMKKIKFEEIIKLPYNVLRILLDIKEAESKNKNRLYEYEMEEDSIKEDYRILKDLIDTLNEEK